MDKKGLIASYYDEKQLMEFYYKESLKEGIPKYKNILRSDSKGTCGFFKKGNRYYLNDFSQSRIYGVYDIVQGIYNCSFSEALHHLIDDLRIPVDYSIDTLKRIEEAKNREINTSDDTKFAKSFQYELRNYNLFDKHHWTSFGISRKTLDKFEVKPVRNIDMFGMRTRSFFEIYSYKEDYDSLTYFFPVDGKFKFYTPNSVNREYKWKGNTRSECVFGFSQLDLNSPLKTIIIASGMKDMLCLSEMGFDVIAPMSEPTNLPQSVIETLRLSGKRIIYLYDTDLAGLKFATKYACLNAFEAIWLPKIPGQSLKDVADFCQFFGIDETKELINVMINNKLN